VSTKALEIYLKILQKFISINNITEVCINKPQEIFLEVKNKFIHHEIKNLTYENLAILVELVAEFNQQEISKEKPLLSATLPGGERAQFVIPPACEQGKIICSIRKHQMQDMTLNKYITAGAFDSISNSIYKHNHNEVLKELYHRGNWPEFIKAAVLAKKNIIISGGTGTGKTTFLNACLKVIPDTERLITIEDTREVQITQPNHVHLLAAKGQQGIAKINMRDLFECCLRLRPDRIFLSELRGEEAFAFLRAANSGHPGSITTIHADTPQGCFEQLVFMMQQAGSTSSDERILSYVKSIIPIVIQLKRCPSGDRFMTVSDIYYSGA
jgi:type IV secretion system protein VirB11